MRTHRQWSSVETSRAFTAASLPVSIHVSLRFRGVDNFLEVGGGGGGGGGG